MGTGATSCSVSESGNAETVVGEDAVGDGDVLSAEVAEGAQLSSSIHDAV